MLGNTPGVVDQKEFRMKKQFGMVEESVHLDEGRIFVDEDRVCVDEDRDSVDVSRSIQGLKLMGD
jgi:hypothetical protein